MVIVISVGRLVLQREGIALFDIERIRFVDRLIVHVEVIDGDLHRGKVDVLERDYIVLDCKLILFRTFGRLVVRIDNILIACLCCDIVLVGINRLFLDSGRGARNSNRLGFRDLDLRMILQHIINRIGKFGGDRVVVEIKDVFTLIEGESLGDFVLLRHMAGDRRGFFGDVLVLYEGGVGYRLAVQDLVRGGLIILNVPLVIIHRIADGLLRPVRIDRDVFHYWGLPVVRRRRILGANIPALEVMAFSRGILRLGSLKAVFLRLACRINGRAAVGIEGDGAGRERKVAVQHQAGGHLVAARIGTGVSLVGVPATPGRAVHRRIGHVVCQIAGDVVSKGDLLRADQRTVIVIERQRIRLRIIVEVETGVSGWIMVTPIIIVIGAKRGAPIIVETLVRTILSFTACCRITGFGITGDLIPVVGIAQIVIPHVDLLNAAVGLAIVSRRGVAALIVLKPVFKMLIVIRSIIVPMHINRVRRAAVRANIQRRHDRQTLEFVIIFSGIAPAVLGVVSAAE